MQSRRMNNRFLIIYIIAIPAMEIYMSFDIDLKPLGQEKQISKAFHIKT